MPPRKGVSKFSGSFDVKMGNFETGATLVGFMSLSVATSIGAKSQCQLGGVRRFPEKFDTPPEKSDLIYLI